jgi:hypothetical protein
MLTSIHVLPYMGMAKNCGRGPPFLNFEVGRPLSWVVLRVTIQSLANIEDKIIIFLTIFFVFNNIEYSMVQLVT